jgi:hypothetical protein
MQAHDDEIMFLKEKIMALEKKFNSRIAELEREIRYLRDEIYDITNCQE